MRLVIALATAWLLLATLVFVFQPYFVYFPSRKLEMSPGQLGLGYESVFITTDDGVKVHGWYVPATGPRASVLVFHGNGGNISHRLPLLWIFNQLRVDTFIIDYRGYGQSEGRASELGTYHDAEAAWRYLTAERGIRPEQIVLVGESLGGAVAVWLATRYRPAGIITLSTFTSIYDMARRYYPYLPVSLLLRFHYPTLKWISQLTCPVLIAHSPEDEIVPFEHGQQLFRSAPEPKTFLELKGGHNEVFLVSEDHLVSGLERFFSEVVPD